MSRTQEIKEAIRAIAGGNRGGSLFLVGEVKSVDGETCTVDVAGLEIDEVRLTAVNDGADGKLLLTPKEGSMVLLADMSGGTLRDLAVVGFTNVEKVEATCDSIELNGGDNGGLVNIESLKNNLDSLKKYVEAMKSAIANGFTSVGASTAANGPAGRATFEGAMAAQQINFEDMEDTKITH